MTALATISASWTGFVGLLTHQRDHLVGIEDAFL
jgi:hypothetical protein